MHLHNHSQNACRFHLWMKLTSSKSVRTGDRVYHWTPSEAGGACSPGLQLHQHIGASSICCL